MGVKGKMVELAEQVAYPIKVDLVVYSRSRAIILGLNEGKIQYVLSISALYYYDVMIFELELDFAQFFFVIGVHNFSYSVQTY